MSNYRYLVKVDKKANKNAFTTWLDSLEWSFWCTGTTAYPMSMLAARLQMTRYFSRIKRLHSTAFNTKGIQPRMFWVAEPFDTRQGFHTHFLLYASNDFTYSEYKKEWGLSAGKGKSILEDFEWTQKSHRFLIQKYQKGLGADAYCTKYIQKKLSDYDILF
jgi:hypothetical protein